MTDQAAAARARTLLCVLLVDLRVATLVADRALEALAERLEGVADRLAWDGQDGGPVVIDCCCAHAVGVVVELVRGLMLRGGKGSRTVRGTRIKAEAPGGARGLGGDLYRCGVPCQAQDGVVRRHS
jgi:hypothetical protein